MIALAMLTATAGVQAQVINNIVTLGNDDDYFIPAEYSADGKSHIVSIEFSGDFSDNDDDSNSFNKVSVYDDDLNVIKSFNVPFYPGIDMEVLCFNYNTGLSYGDLYIAVTQTLFNNDGNYEYISPVYSSSETYEENRIGFNIVSENGDVLQTTTYEDGMYVTDLEIVAINEKRLLRAVVNTKSDGTYHYYYSINPNASSIKQIGEPVKANVHPSLVGRNETLTIELSGNESNNRVVTVHDAGGRTVYRTTVPAGQNTLQINSSELSQGLNVVYVTGKNGSGIGGKIIVK